MLFIRSNAYFSPLLLFSLFFIFLVFVQSLNSFYLRKEKWLREINTNKNFIDIVENEVVTVPQEKIEEVLKRNEYPLALQRKIDPSKNSDIYIIDKQNKIISLFPKNIPSLLENHLSNISKKKFNWCYLEIKDNLYIIKNINEKSNYSYILLKIKYIQRDNEGFRVSYDDFIYKNGLNIEYTFIENIYSLFLYLFGVMLIIFLVKTLEKKSRKSVSDLSKKYEESCSKLNSEIDVLSNKYYAVMESEKICKSTIIKYSRLDINEISKSYSIFKDLYKEDNVKYTTHKLKGLFIYNPITGQCRNINSIFNEVLEIHRHILDFKNIKITFLPKIRSTEVYKGSNKIIYSLINLIIDILQKELKNNSSITVLLCKKNKDTKVALSFEWNGLISQRVEVASLKPFLDLVRIKVTLKNDKIEFIFPVVEDKKMKEVSDSCSNVVKLPPRYNILVLINYTNPCFGK